ncbi:hypothetical protein P7D22_12400 [Lichenihabitans sp. Uapishka_5]|uniref:hypothetical protein n=1 Tax=Lichenihabitans sp. Uapishka_5 TaxID=3037302 RepID=UPI0029E7DE2D|nr:hypothetical protein [Lichenihabitans sp. Uapishka_5]MDX7951971.1 hypothetical protein [Lichenihabitans sp. Uapishka_5]
MTQQRQAQNDHSTVAQLKADIDAGRTGDKVANADPGLSPLGTDDEAAGNPVSPDRIDMARRIETRIGAAAGPAVRDTTSPKGVSIGLMVGVIVVIAIVVAAAVFFR